MDLCHLRVQKTRRSISRKPDTSEAWSSFLFQKKNKHDDIKTSYKWFDGQEVGAQKLVKLLEQEDRVGSPRGR